MSKKDKECFGNLLCRLEELDSQIVKMKAQIKQLRILITDRTGNILNKTPGKDK